MARLLSEGLPPRPGPCGPLKPNPMPSKLAITTAAGRVPWVLCSTARPAGGMVVDCCRVARDLRPLLEAGGFAPLAKTSGGKGLQLYAPISGVTSEEASDQARMFAERLERDQPRRVVSRMTKVLRTGKVLIDWSQNNGSKTTIAPYSLRARSHPTVSTPVSWDEVEACRRREDLFFTADAVLDRVAQHGDLFAPLLLPPAGPPADRKSTRQN